jgi:hypothetical protein
VRRVLRRSPLYAPQFPADHRPGVLAAWSWTHLAALCGGGAGAATAWGAKQDPQPVWPVAISAPAKDLFIVADPDKNAFGSFYHVRVRTRRGVSPLLRKRLTRMAARAPRSQRLRAKRSASPTLQPARGSGAAGA